MAVRNICYSGVANSNGNHRFISSSGLATYPDVVADARNSTGRSTIRFELRILATSHEVNSLCLISHATKKWVSRKLIDCEKIVACTRYRAVDGVDG